MQMLVVNGNVSDYWVHQTVCNLKTIKSTKKVSRLRKSAYPNFCQALVSPNCHLPCPRAAFCVRAQQHQLDPQTMYTEISALTTQRQHSSTHLY